MRPTFIVEHLEPKISGWLWLEYKHCRKFGKIIFTNVKDPVDRMKLSAFGEVYAASVKSKPQLNMIVLDPQAKKKLIKADLKSRPFLVIGGIIGDDPPKKRTHAQLTSKLRGVPARNLGKAQLSIDGAACIAAAVARGKRFGIAENPEIKLSPTHSIVLHYAVPKIGGKIVMAPGIKTHLVRKGFA